MPVVASQHYFDKADFDGVEKNWQYRGGENVPGTANTYKQHIDYLIQLRKDLGIEYDSEIEVLKESSATRYLAEITGKNGTIIVNIGTLWSPNGEGYEGNYPIYSGKNFAIWQKDNPGVAPADVNLTITVQDDWLWSDGAVLFAWVWGGDHSTAEHPNGEWIPASGSGTTINLTIKDNATGFLLVRCYKGTSEPDWKWAGDVEGRIYNKSPNINFEKGTTKYTAEKFVDYNDGTVYPEQPAEPSEPDSATTSLIFYVSIPNWNPEISDVKIALNGNGYNWNEFTMTKCSTSQWYKFVAESIQNIDSSITYQLRLTQSGSIKYQCASETSDGDPSITAPSGFVVINLVEHMDWNNGKFYSTIITTPTSDPKY